MKSLLYGWLLICLVSCGTAENKLSHPLSPSRLESQFFEVNPARDTVLSTAHASIVRIRKGTFTGDQPVRVEIKEAFTPVEILMAGMTTTSNGRPLRSAGMLYFQASNNGSSLPLRLPVAISIPTSRAHSDMQLFTGEMQQDSAINWIDPKPLKMDTLEKDCQETGKAIFQSKCRSCHQIFTAGTGPALRNLQHRGPWKNRANLYAWIQNNPAFMENSAYTKNLRAEFGSVMPSFPDLKPETIDCVVDYINTADHDEPVPALDTSVMLQNCGYDTTYINRLNDFPEYDTSNNLDLIQADSTGLDDNWGLGVSQDKYDLNITANGWYNVDAFIQENEKDCKQVKLAARLGTDVLMTVFVFVPSERIMLMSTDEDENLYSFAQENDRILLPYRYRAIIFAVGSYKDKILYGISEFTVANEQVVPVAIQETTQKGLQYLLQSKNIRDVQIEAIEKQMQLNPIYCDDGPQFCLVTPRVRESNTINKANAP